MTRMDQTMIDYLSEIATARKRAGLTQAAMSDLLGIPKRTIEDWESGKRKCPDYVKRLVVDKLNSSHEKSNR